MTNHLLKLPIALMAAMLCTTLLQAGEITVNGSAGGVFGTYVSGLTYTTPPNFSVTTASGISTLSNLGSLHLPTGNYTDTFTSQIDISGVTVNNVYNSPNPSYFTLNGTITSANGNVSLVFTGSPETVTYTNYSVYPSTSAHFYFGLNNISSATPGQTITLTGFADETLPSAVSPEPSSYALSAAGLTLLVLGAWRRRRAKTSLRAERS